MNKFFLVAATTLLCACGATTSIDEYRPSNSVMEINRDESVVILGRRDAGHYDTDREFISCVAGRMKGANINVMPEQQFIDSIYPWFEPRTAPLGTADLPTLLANEVVAKRIDDLGVRYMIWVDGATNTTDQAGSMTCTISPGGGGCFGFVTWARDASYEATVWDLKTQQSLGRISSDANGTSYMPAMVVPVPIIARVQAQACSGLADQLETFLSAPATENAG